MAAAGRNSIRGSEYDRPGRTIDSSGVGAGCYMRLRFKVEATGRTEVVSDLLG